VALLHSGLSDSESWDEVVPTLAVAHQVIRYDARGFGRSPDPVADYDVLDDLAGVLAATGVESAHLVGNSMGAAVARVAAIERPELVRSLTLVGPGYREPEPPPESVARLERWRAATSAGEVEVAARPPADTAHAVENIKVPTLVIAGAQDDPWVLGASRVLAERIPGARLVLIEGARHHPQEDRPEEFAAALLEFLGGIT